MDLHIDLDRRLGTEDCESHSFRVRWGVSGMETYVVLGVEEVYDAFDEYEHANPLPPFSVRATSIGEAKDQGTEAIEYFVRETRKGFFSSGSFVARVIQIADESGELVLDESQELVRVWPFRSDERSVIPADGLPARVAFLAHSSGDNEFAQALTARLKAHRFVIWFAPERPDMPKDSTEEEALLRGKIAEGIAAARVVLVVVSKQSAGSDWVAFETSSAIEGQEASGRPAIIGLRLEPVADQPPWLRQLQDRFAVRDWSRWRDETWLSEQTEQLAAEMRRTSELPLRKSDS